MKKKLQKHHLGYISGPILFTAPHSKEIFRGGEEYGGEEKNEGIRVHKREMYASWVSVQLAHNIRMSENSPPLSFCVWGDINKNSMDEKDPNYLLEEMFEKSQFHLALHAWAEKNKELPLLHIDIHGKSDQEVCNIDIGIKSIEEHWGKQDPLVQKFTDFFKDFASIFEESEVSKCAFNMHGDFEGCWKKYKKWKPDRYSMTEQAIKLGIPSLQMQLPKAVRKELFQNSGLFKKFAEGFSRLYQAVIVPYYSYKQEKHPLRTSSILAQNFDITVDNQEQVKEVLQQITLLQK